MSSIDVTGPAFLAMAHRIVWSTVATADTGNGLRTRVLHPIWEWDGTRLTGWIATSPTEVKTRALVADPRVSLTYWDHTQDTCTADCHAEWIDDSECEALWNRFADAPAPVGYDPAIIPPWADGPQSPAFSGWKLDPFRLRVMPGSLMTAGQGSLLTWRA
ncbi:MAG: pyridoxamine 5'-phosphate oxidase family protein [Acidimicrobiales bacterium]